MPSSSPIVQTVSNDPETDERPQLPDLNKLQLQMLHLLAREMQDQERDKFNGLLSLLPFKLVELELKAQSWPRNSWEIRFILSPTGKAVLALLQSTET